MTPLRILDTRDGTGGHRGALVGPQTLTLAIAGHNGVPADATAVVLNVTATNTTASSYLTVFSDNTTRPLASNLNWTAGMTVPNLVEIPIGSGGGINFFNAAGSADVIADLEGYVSGNSSSPSPAGLFKPSTPARVLDTRNNIGGYSRPISAGQTIAVTVASPGQEAVVLNVTATNPTAAGYLTIWPHGAQRPLVSNLNFLPGQTIANRVMVKVDSTGSVDIFSPAGSVDVIADVNGSFTSAAGAVTGARFQGTRPVRLLDTRDGTGGFHAPLGPGASMAVPVAGTNGIPADVVAVTANLTVTDASAASYLTAWPHGVTRPEASDLNWVAGKTVPNLVVVKLGEGGKLDLYNAAGSVDVIIDVTGWYR